MLQMILDDVRSNATEFRQRFQAVETKLDDQAKDTRKYTDTRLRELEERVKEREATEIKSLTDANVAQDKIISELKTRVDNLSKWSDGVKAKAAVVLTIVTFLGASGGAIAAKFIPGG